MTYPKKWQGLACLAPSFKGSYSYLHQLKDIPIIVITGDKDRLIPVKSVRRWVDEIKKQNLDVFYK